MEVRPFEPEYTDLWASLLDAAATATLFHDLRFLSYHPEGRFDFHHLTFWEDDRLVAVLPAHVSKNSGHSVLVSPAGASVGGFATLLGFPATKSLELVECLKVYAKAQAFDSICLRLGPPEYMTVPDNLMGFALQTAGFELKRRWLVLMVPVDEADPADYLQSLSSGKRRDVRAGQRKGLIPCEGTREDVTSFYQVLEENQRRLTHSSPTHTCDELQRLFQLFPGRIRLFLCHDAGKIAAGIVAFLVSKTTAMTFYISQINSSRGRYGTTVLLAHVCEQFVKEGLRFVDLGPTSFDDHSLNAGLVFFKEGFGARAYCRDKWVWHV